MKNKTVLLADDDREFLIALAKRCEGLGLHVEMAFDALTALNLVHEADPDLVCLDIEMPSGNGLSACEMMATDEKTRSIPVIMVTGHAEPDILEHCRFLSAKHVLKGSNLWDRLRPVICESLDIQPVLSSEGKDPIAVRSLDSLEEVDENISSTALIDCVFEILGANPDALVDDDKPAESGVEQRWDDSPPWVLCIEDDQDFSLALKLKLEHHGINVIRAFEGIQGVQTAMNRPADAIILDFNLPNGQGDYVLNRLKKNSMTKDIPVILLTGVKDQTLEQRMLGMGAAKFLTKPLVFADLLEELRIHIQLPVTA